MQHRARFRADSSSCHQLSSHEEQVAEREELGAVLGQPAVAGLHLAELALDDPERVLDLEAFPTNMGAT